MNRVSKRLCFSSMPIGATWRHAEPYEPPGSIPNAAFTSLARTNADRGGFPLE